MEENDKHDISKEDEILNKRRQKQGREGGGGGKMIDTKTIKKNN